MSANPTHFIRNQTKVFSSCGAGRQQETEDVDGLKIKRVSTTV